MRNALSFLKDIYVILQGICLFFALLTITGVTYPVLIFFSILIWFIEHNAKLSVKIRRELNSFNHLNVSPLLEKVIESGLALKLKEKGQIPLELVQAYLFLSKREVFEVKNSDNKLLRSFKVNPSSGLIIVKDETREYSSETKQAQLVDLTADLIF